MKRISFSKHALLQATLRGATEAQIAETIIKGKWTPAHTGKFRAEKQFDFFDKSPVNLKYYKYKIIEAIFADEEDEIVVVTVKVFYFNKGAAL